MTNSEVFKAILFDYSKRINDCANRILGAESSSQGLTVLQLRLLMDISHKGSQTVGGAADSLGLAGANASMLCKKLEKAGFLSRFRDQRDERIVRLELTEKARSLIGASERRFQDRIAGIMAQEDEGSIKSMIDGMERFNRLLGRIEEARPGCADYDEAVKHKEIES